MEGFSHCLGFLEFSAEPLSRRGFSRTGTEGVYMAWLAMLPFKMTVLCFPFECVKVDKTSAFMAGDVGYSFSCAGGNWRHSAKEDFGSQFYLCFALFALYFLPPPSLLSLSPPCRAHDVYQDAPWSYYRISASGDLPVSARVSTVWMHVRSRQYSSELMLWRTLHSLNHGEWGESLTFPEGGMVAIN